MNVSFVELAAERRRDEVSQYDEREGRGGDRHNRHKGDFEAAGDGHGRGRPSLGARADRMIWSALAASSRPS